MKRRTSARPIYSLALAACALFAAGYALAAWVYRPITFRIEAHCVAPPGTTFHPSTSVGVEPPGAQFFNPRSPVDPDPWHLFDLQPPGTPPLTPPNMKFPIRPTCWSGHAGIVTWGVTICQEEI